MAVSCHLASTSQHKGVELGIGYRSTQWKLDTAATWLNAKRFEALIDPAQNGQRPLNVPTLVMRAAAEYRWSQVPGLRTSFRLSHEGQRDLMEGGAMTLPAMPSAEMPFGGIKDSGYGSEGGPEAMDAYLNARSVTIMNV